MVTSKTWGSRAADIIIITILALIAFTSIAPILNTLAISFSSSAKAATGTVLFWPKDITWASYGKLLEDDKFFHAFFVSVKRVILGVALNLIMTILMAFPLSRDAKVLPLRNLFMWVVVFTMMFSGGLIPFYLTISKLGLIDSIWVLVLPGAVNAFYIILMVNFFRNIPKELDESARIDGAGPIHLLLRIYMQVSVPIIATLALFSMVGHWNSFFDGLIFMNKTENYPLQTYIQQLIVRIDPTKPLSSEDLPELQLMSERTINAAKIFVTMLPVVVVYPFLQRFFITGIMLGSVKE